MLMTKDYAYITVSNSKKGHELNMVDKTLNDFLSLLFDKEDWTCFTASPNGTAVFYEPSPTDLFFSINPLHSDVDLNPTLPYHKPSRARRADHNVTKYRNFLIELDSMPLEEQVDYVTSKLPVTSIVYSGGKSYHFIISLTSPIPSKAEYDLTFKRIQKLLPKIDKACKNPSRLSRLPFSIRPDTANEQRLVALYDRIDWLTLNPLLPIIEEKKREYSNEKSKSYISIQLAEAMTFPEKVMNNVGLSGRNQFFFWLGNRIKELDCDDARSYTIVTRAYENLSNKDNFTFDEALSAARVK